MYDATSKEVKESSLGTSLLEESPSLLEVQEVYSSLFPKSPKVSSTKYLDYHFARMLERSEPFSQTCKSVFEFS